MRQVYEFCQRAIQRVNARIAILVVVVLAGGVAVWQGFAHLPQKQPDLGPKKQVATGPDAAGAAEGAFGGGHGIQPAGATLSDDELPPTSPANRLTGYGRVGDAAGTSGAELAPPATSPYAAAGSDAGGGYQSSAALSPSYGGGSYGGGSYGGANNAAAADMPADPTAGSAGDAVPSNPYRQAGTLSQSPYATNSEGNAATGADSASSAAITVMPPNAPPTNGTSDAGVANPYATPYEPPQTTSPYAMSGGGLSQPQAITPNALPQGAPPANPLPAEGLSGSPYASSGTGMPGVSMPGASPGNGMRSLNGSNAGGGSGGLSNYRAAGPHPSPLPEGEGTRRLAAATPGERMLEGPQQPAITIEKVSPAEIQVGKPAMFEIYVRNAGQVAAHNVVISDHVPARTQLVDAKPQPRQGTDGSLVWQIDVMQPGEERHFSVQVMPQEEGEVGSTAHLTFAAAATSRSVCTRPQLTIEQHVSPKVLIGEPLAVAITVSNPGSGPATGVVIEADVPPGLSHVAGSQLEYEVGTLKPLESKRLELTMRAEQAGLLQNTIRVVGEGSLMAQHTAQVEVIAPQLAVAVEGPKVKFLERQANYTLQVANTGTAPARDVELVAQLPRGMKFVETDAQGQYDPRMHAVIWSLAELPPATSGPVKLTMLPVEPGEQKLVVKGTTGLGLTAAAEQVVNVMQSEELHHTVKDMDDVIEVGSETAYEIRVVNSGTKAATNVRVAAQMPPGIAAIDGQGPTRASADATQVVFDPLPRLNPNEEVIFKVSAQGRQAGDHIVRVQLSSDEWKTPVSREESTRVYQER